MIKRLLATIGIVSLSLWLLGCDEDDMVDIILDEIDDQLQ